jgi:hypothetical protein
MVVRTLYVGLRSAGIEIVDRAAEFPLELFGLYGSVQYNSQVSYCQRFRLWFTITNRCVISVER